MDEIQKKCPRRTEDVCRRVDIWNDVILFPRLPQVSSQALCTGEACGSGNRGPNRVIARIADAFVSTGATFGLRNTGFIHCLHRIYGILWIVGPQSFLLFGNI